MPYEQPQWSPLSSVAEATAFENILASHYNDDDEDDFDEFEPDEEDDETLPFNLPPLTGGPGTVFGRDI
jgi:hypothetical protein